MDDQEGREYHATELLSDLRAADTETQYFPTLRDAARHVPATSALDLPLWRPSVSPTAVVPEAESPAEQTDIRHVVSHVSFQVMRHDIHVCFKQWSTDNKDSDREVLAGVRRDLAELDEYARQVGFTNASARSLGRRLARRELTPEDAAAELRALH